MSDDRTQDQTDPTDPTDLTEPAAGEEAGPRRNQPPRSPKAPRATAAQVERRITSIFAAVVAGLQTWEIRRAVAEMQVKERRQREERRVLHLNRLRRAVDEGEPAAAVKARTEAEARREAAIDVPLVWGDEEVPQRTFEHYLEKARGLLDTQADTFGGLRARALAQQKARLDALYSNAVSSGKLYAALKAVELQVDLFGLKEFARLQMLNTQNRTGEDGAETADAQLLPTSPEARANAFASLVAASVEGSPELRAALAELNPRPIMP